jgi:hypothetical protein
VVGTDGHSSGSSSWIAPMTRVTIKLAKQCIDGGNDIGLWQGDRFVIRLVRKAD